MAVTITNYPFPSGIKFTITNNLHITTTTTTAGSPANGSHHKKHHSRSPVAKPVN